VVPASSRVVKGKKDSVEMLLDGMGGPQPEHPKTTPMTDGEASAAYHAEHEVRPARTSPDEEPSVVVERAPQTRTTKLDRTMLQGVIDQVDARRLAPDTIVDPVPLSIPEPSQEIAPRVLVAVVSGLMVVLGLFVILRFTRTDGDASKAPVEPQPAVQTATATAAVVPPIVAAATASSPPVVSAAPAPSPVATEAPTPVATATPAPTTPRRPVPAAGAPTAKPRNPRPASTSTGGDMGEFKTTLH
jgi:hypothetical protein